MTRLTIHPTYRYPNGLQEGPPSGGGQGADAGTTGRRLVLGFAGLLLLLILFVLAWVLSNLNDADPQPRPAALALPQAQVPAAQNSAFALMGLFAAADRDPAQVGRAMWAEETRVAQALQDPQAIQTPQTFARRSEVLQEREKALASLQGARLSPPAVEPWTCNPLQSDCVVALLAKPDLLAQQRQSAAVLLSRCDALLDPSRPDKALPFEEVLPMHWHTATPLAGHASAAAVCMQGWQAAAVLAFRQGLKDEAWRLTARSNALLRTLLAGSHNLVSQSVLQGLLGRHLAFVSQLLAQDPARAQQALPLVAAWGAPEQFVRRWVLVEAAFSQAALKEAAAGASLGADLPAGNPPDSALGAWFEGAERRVQAWLVSHHIGWHPERSAQLLDQQWLGLLKQVDGGLPAALTAGPAGLQDGNTSVLRWWRNTLGRAAAELVPAAHNEHIRRALDLELRREATALAVNALRLQVAPAARAAWAQQQTLSPALAERLQWSADGRSLAVRPWAADAAPASVAVPERHRIGITLDRAPG